MADQLQGKPTLRQPPQRAPARRKGPEKNTFLENTRLLDVKPEEIPSHVLDNNLKSRTKRRKSSPPLTDNPEEIVVESTALAEMSVPRKKKGIDEDNETLAQKKLRRKER